MFHLINSNFQSLFGTMAVMIGSGMLCRSLDYDNTLIKHLAWALHCGASSSLIFNNNNANSD